MDARNRKQLFLADLNKLLAKHGAELEVKDDGKGYGMQSGVCNICMQAVYKGGEIEKDFSEFELPTYMDGE